MTISAAIALRTAVRSLLLASQPLLDRLGGPKVFEEAPRNADMPYVTFGDVRSRDWSTSSDKGAEHTLIVDVWTQHHGPAAALEVAELVSAILADIEMAMQDHRLISFFEQSIETRRELNGRAWRARLIFRVITEKM